MEKYYMFNLNIEKDFLDYLNSMGLDKDDTNGQVFVSANSKEEAIAYMNDTFRIELKDIKEISSDDVYKTHKEILRYLRGHSTAMVIGDYCLDFYNFYISFLNLKVDKYKDFLTLDNKLADELSYFIGSEMTPPLTVNG